MRMSYSFLQEAKQRKDREKMRGKLAFPGEKAWIYFGKYKSFS